MRTWQNCVSPGPWVAFASFFCTHVVLTLPVFFLGSMFTIFCVNPDAIDGTADCNGPIGFALMLSALLIGLFLFGRYLTLATNRTSN